MREILKLYFELPFRIISTCDFWNSFIISASYLSSIWSLLIWLFLNLLIWGSAQAGLNVLLQLSCFTLSGRWRLSFLRFYFQSSLNFQLLLLSQGWKYIYSTCKTHFLICHLWLYRLFHNHFTWWYNTLQAFKLWLLCALQFFSDHVNNVNL